MDPMPGEGGHEAEKIERLRRAIYSRQLSQRLDMRGRRALSPEHELVREDWRRNEPGVATTTVAPWAIGIARKVLWMFLLLASIFFIGAVAYFGYFFVFGGGSLRASSSNIDIAVAGPSQLSGGEKTELQIVVTNRNNVPLTLAELVITYPDGTRSPSDLATPLPSQRISLGTIEPGGRRQGTVTAVFAGNSGEHATVKVELEYHLAGSSAIFVAPSQYAAIFGSSALSVSVTGNEQATAGQPILLNVVVSSNTSVPVRNVLLRADYPFGFTFSAASPAPTVGTVWALGDLSPGQQLALTIRGTLTGESNDERVFRFTAGTASSSVATTTITTIMSAASHHAVIARPFLDLGMTINGQDAANGVIVSPGETVTVSIAYRNNLTTDITNAVIVGRLSGAEVDGSTVRSSDGFYRSSDASILWDRTTTAGALSRITPGQRGQLSFTFKVPDEGAIAVAGSSQVTIALSAAGTRRAEKDVPETLQATAQSRIAIGSDVQLIAQGLYYASPFGSVGPLPPKADTETTYAIVFTVKNTTSKITDAQLTAQLPSYVRWIGTRSPASEQVSLNQETGVITWRIGEIEAGTGTGSSTPRQLAIAIGFTPSTSQLGEQPVLMQNVELTGRDAATGAAVTRTAKPDVTTNLTQIGKSSEATVSGTDPGFNPANATVVK